MFWRTTTALLLTLNAAALAYGYFNPAPRTLQRAKTEPDIASLTLLSERDDGAMAVIAASNAARSAQANAANAANQTRLANPATPQLASASNGTSASSRCYRLGPFTEQDDAERALGGAKSYAEQMQVKQDTIRETRGYWVYLAAETDRENALKTARQLSAANIRDYYVVTAGENENAISLGMFKDAINADKRIAQIAGLGFFPKRAERFDEQPRFFIEFSPKLNPASANLFDAKWLQKLELPREVRVANFRCQL